MDTFVHIKGILRDGCEHDTEPNFVSQTFVAHHESDEQFKAQMETVMGDVYRIGGLIVVKDPAKRPTYNNVKVVFLQTLDRLEFEVKDITGGDYMNTGSKTQ